MAIGFEALKTVFERAIRSNTFNKCLKNVKLLSAGNGQCKAEFTVSEDHLNSLGSLHGGFTSLLVDSISTFALMTQGTGSRGVSIDLHIAFMKAAIPGELVTVDAKTIRAGRTLAFLNVELTKNNGKDMIAHGQHTKYIG